MKMRKIQILALAAALLCCVLLGGCGSEPAATETTGDDSGEITCRVTVTDALGNPCGDGIIVRFMQGGEQVAMQVADENGLAEKTLPKGEYTLDVAFTDTEAAYRYDTTGLVLTESATEAQILLAKAVEGEPTVLFAQGKESNAYSVEEGCTYVTVNAGERTYFLFTPTRAGTYEFSVADNAAAIGYYGAPHFVQDITATEVVDNVFTLSIKADMIGSDGTGTAVVVIGLDAGAETECILTIERTGDPAWSVEDEPWSVYTPTVELANYTLPAGAKLGSFDITAETGEYNLVFNEADGYYHLDSQDGPLVLVWLTEDPDYLPCFKNILDRSGVSKYFYDDNGEFVKKEEYSNCLLSYIACADEESGLYPLTEDLKYIIQQRGDYVGWWDPQSPGFIFHDELGTPMADLNDEIAWLFMCCYIEG